MSENIGKLLLRWMLAGMMLFHGVNKALHGVGFIKGLVHGQGLPEWAAYGVFIGEIVAPLFLILGWKSRLWAGIIALNMAVAIYLTQMASFMQSGAHGAWAMEVSMFYFLTAVIIVFLGSGKYAVMRD